jgi:hypothetical protein
MMYLTDSFTENRRLESNSQRQQPQEYDMRLFVNSVKTGKPLSQASREKIIEEYLGFSGVSFHSEISRSNWADRQLNKAQIMEARVDAYASFLIGKKARI